MAFITVPGGFAHPCRLFSSEARVAAADGCRDGHWSEGGFSSAPIGLGSGSFTAWLLWFPLRYELIKPSHTFLTVFRNS